MERRWPGPPLALQIAGLLLGGLVVAQLVTLFLTLMLPPAPEPEYRLNDIAAALNGADVHPKGGRALIRTIQAQPPGEAAGWLVSPQSQHDLAKTLGRRDDDVRLLFYTPLPFAGAVSPSHRAAGTAMADAPTEMRLASIFELAQLAPPPLPPQIAPPPGGPPPDLNQVTRAMPRVPPPAGAGGSQLGPPPPVGDRGRQPPSGTMPHGFDALQPGAVVMEGQIPLGPQGRQHGASAAPPVAIDGAEAGPPPQGQQTSGAAQTAPPASGSADALPQSLPPTILSIPRLPAVRSPVSEPPEVVVQRSLAPAPTARAQNVEPGTAQSIGAAAPVASVESQPLVDTPAVQASSAPLPVESDGPAPVAPVVRGLFGLAPAPFVQGDFVAAVRLPDGRWAVVQPTPEPFPNSWQRRILLWFALSFALVAPLGLMFARRLVKPLEGFADAAEKLGRDPRAPVMTLAGPAEIGRAARAFNQMQSRLRRFVDDRTAMVGAISHDLRTPLTRMRFRLEEAPDHVRDGMLEEVAQMEEMITSVLHFIRDASEPNSRETMDMRSILASVVDGATLTGGDVTLEPGISALVDVDALGMKRVLSNLVDNALKYGDAARIRLFKDGDDAVAEVVDEGPGLPEDELERVFQPFYRGPAARSSSKAGIGLGLAACRSITRAHGGDVSLRRSDDGLVAQVRLPLAEVAHA